MPIGSWLDSEFSWLTAGMRELVFVLSLAPVLSAQASPHPADAYLLRLEHSNRQSHVCSLVKSSGDFHLEVDGSEQTRVFVGQLDPNQLLSLEHALDDRRLENLSQEQIEEPLVSNGRDILDVSIFRYDHWQELRFETSESQAPFEKSLAPLLGWLTKFEKLRRQELSEDAGKNNCLPPKKLALKRRDSSLPPPVLKPRIASRPPSTQPPAGTLDSAGRSILLGMLHFRTGDGGAHQSCMLIADDGEYRFEDRVQPSGAKVVHTRISLGRMSAEEIAELRKILDSPNLAAIRHHEPAGGLVVRMMGDMLRLSIARPNGVQEIILSSNQRASGYFYTGDADLGRARELLKFLSEHAANPRAKDPESIPRNDCKQLP